MDGEKSKNRYIKNSRLVACLQKDPHSLSSPSRVFRMKYARNGQRVAGGAAAIWPHIDAKSVVCVQSRRSVSWGMPAAHRFEVSRACSVVAFARAVPRVLLVEIFQIDGPRTTYRSSSLSLSCLHSRLSSRMSQRVLSRLSKQNKFQSVE